MHHHKGLTLVELAIAIAIIAILVAIAQPSFSQLISNQRSNTAAKQINQSFMFARNQALNYGARVTVCQLEGNNCSTSTDWQNGYSVFIDNGVVGIVDNDNGQQDVIINVINSFNNQDQVQVSAASFSFESHGFLNANAATIQLSYCPPKKQSSQCKLISISPAGKINTSDKPNT